MASSLPNAGLKLERSKVCILADTSFKVQNLSQTHRIIAFVRPCVSSHSRREPGPRTVRPGISAARSPMQTELSMPCLLSLVACSSTSAPGCSALNSGRETLNIRAGRRPRASKRATSALSRVCRTSEASTTNSRRGRTPFFACSACASPSSSSSVFRRKRAPHVRQSSAWPPSGFGASGGSTWVMAPWRSSSSSSTLASRSNEATWRRQAESKERVASGVLIQSAL
mmetsp:Transcript_967/g.3436  ORF Transcript_967/g.3436 Transcript_967/m.3436 type:complete len:227 (+) Transcript_967:233-913(+)